jgi:hypothetical protein
MQDPSTQSPPRHSPTVRPRRTPPSRPPAHITGTPRKASKCGLRSADTNAQQSWPEPKDRKPFLDDGLSRPSGDRKLSLPPQRRELQDIGGKTSRRLKPWATSALTDPKPSRSARPGMRTTEPAPSAVATASPSRARWTTSGADHVRLPEARCAERAGPLQRPALKPIEKDCRPGSPRHEARMVAGALQRKFIRAETRLPRCGTHEPLERGPCPRRGRNSEGPAAAVPHTDVIGRVHSDGVRGGHWRRSCGLDTSSFPRSIFFDAPLQH